MVERRGDERRGKEKRERTGYERDERNERRAQRNTATIEDAGVPSRRVKGSGYLETDLPGKEWHGPRKMKSPSVPAWRKGREVCLVYGTARHRHRISVKSKGADLVARKLATKFGESKREREKE